MTLLACCLRFRNSSDLSKVKPPGEKWSRREVSLFIQLLYRNFLAQQSLPVGTLVYLLFSWQLRGVVMTHLPCLMQPSKNSSPTLLGLKCSTHVVWVTSLRKHQWSKLAKRMENGVATSHAKVRKWCISKLKTFSWLQVYLYLSHGVKYFLYHHRLSNTSQCIRASPLNPEISVK